MNASFGWSLSTRHTQTTRSGIGRFRTALLGIDPSEEGSVNVTLGTASELVDTTLQVPESTWFFFNLGTTGATAG